MSQSSSTPAPRAYAVQPATARALLVEVARHQQKSRVPGLVAGLVRDGALVWSGGRGRRGPDGKDRPDADTQSRIGSITKPFTAILVARLRDEGRLDFADPLESHLPGTPMGDRTIGQLLSHSSGLQAETDGPWWERTAGPAWEGFAPTLTSSMLRHRAGTRFHYSNLGYGLLGEVVARLRGMPWVEALQTEILDPLEMARTSYAPAAPHLSGYAVHPWADVVLPEPAEDAGAMAPAGQLWSTIDDLGRLAAFIAGDTADVLSGSTLEEMRTPNAVEDGPAFGTTGGSGWVAGYGLGLQVLKVGGRTYVGHGGSMPGFLAGIYVDAETGTGAALLANTTGGLPVTTLGAELITILLDREPSLPAEWVPDPAQTDTVSGVLDVVGPWYWGPTAFVLRGRADGWLEAAVLNGGGRASRFRPTGRPGEWLGLDGYYAGETLRAVRDDAGSVTHLDLATFIFTRVPYDPGAPVPGGVDEAGWR